MKRAVGYAVGGCVIGAVLSITALIVVIAQSGYAHASSTCALLVNIGYWPVLVIGWDARELFASFTVIPVNILAWGLLAFLFAVIKQALVRTKKSSR